MKLLLTSGGVTNASIRNALIALLGKPISEADALCIPTASYGHPFCTPNSAWNFITGKSESSLCNLGWKSLGVLELTALPSLDRGRWIKWVEETDALVVDGGDALYLSYWMKQSGLADLLPALSDKVWVGVSAGSMAMTPRIGKEFVQWTPPNELHDDRTLGIVDFSIFPHLGAFPENSMADAVRWAEGIEGVSYAIDEQTAIKVADGVVEVISEGEWKKFPGHQSGFK